jgi:hypothetical protein
LRKLAEGDDDDGEGDDQDSDSEQLCRMSTMLCSIRGLPLGRWWRGLASYRLV